MAWTEWSDLIESGKLIGRSNRAVLGPRTLITRPRKAVTFTLVNKVEARTGHGFDSSSAGGKVLCEVGHCPSRGVSQGRMSRVLCGLEDSFIFTNVNTGQVL